ncbi:MAG: GNAT family N-acetyltransferase [Nitrospiraceae bacterium]|nr:GNAT family N-acetyltransferase [Nitrospiraceae bacterium]
MNISGEIKCWMSAKEYAHVKFSEHSASISLDVLHVPAAHRKKGIGALLIGRLIVLADGLGKGLTVSVRPIGAHNEERLQQMVRYYEKFGFRVTDRGLTVVNMAREARRNDAA